MSLQNLFEPVNDRFFYVLVVNNFNSIKVVKQNYFFTRVTLKVYD